MIVIHRHYIAPNSPWPLMTLKGVHSVPSMWHEREHKVQQPATLWSRGGTWSWQHKPPHCTAQTGRGTRRSSCQDHPSPGKGSPLARRTCSPRPSKNQTPTKNTKDQLKRFHPCFQIVSNEHQRSDEKVPPLFSNCLQWSLLQQPKLPFHIGLSTTFNAQPGEL